MGFNCVSSLSIIISFYFITKWNVAIYKILEIFLSFRTVMKQTCIVVSL